MLADADLHELHKVGEGLGTDSFQDRAMALMIPASDKARVFYDKLLNDDRK